MNTTILRLIGAGLLCALTWGCGGESGPPVPAGLVPFAGTVTLDDKPLGGATITLIPTAAAGAGTVDSGAVTDDSGKYELKSAGGKGVGAIPGEYRVVISRLTRPDGSVVAPTPEKSPLELMTAEKAKESVPPSYSDLLKSRLKVTVPAEGGSHDFKLSSK